MTDGRSQKTNKPSDKQHIPDVEAMKKILLAQIDVTPDDLKVMSIQEITQFYNQLMESCGEKKGQPSLITDFEQNQKTKSKANDAQDTKINQSKDKFTADHKNDQKLSDLNKNQAKMQGDQYYKPKYLSKTAYFLSNRRLSIIYGPRFVTYDQKREAICSAYNPSVAHSVRGLKLHQIQETYQRLRIPQKKQNLIAKLDKQMQVKQFIVNLPSFQFDTDTQFKDNPNLQKPTIEQPIQEKQKSESQPNEIDSQDGFFDQIYSQNQVKQKRDSSKSKIKSKPQVSRTSEPGLRQKIQQLNKRNKLNNQNLIEVQSQNDEEKQPRTRLMVLRHIQYIQAQDDNQQKESRPSPFQSRCQVEDQESQNISRKLNNSQIIRSLLEPSKYPSAQAVEFIKNLKRLACLFEESYINQYD